jgi:pentatricopeptide repeat protein
VCRCGKEGHRERDCPKNSKRADEAKLCLRCGEGDHIARMCPTIANRTVYRNEEKARAAGCYICSEEGHHAEECPQLAVLAEEFAKFQSKLTSGMKLNVKVYNILIEKCAKALELNGALYLYEEMMTRSVAPNDDTARHLQYLYDRSGKDQSKLEDIPMVKKRVARLKAIVSVAKSERKTVEITADFLPAIADYLRMPANATEAAKCVSLYALATHLSKASIPGLTDALSAGSARVALLSLKNAGRYHQKSKSAEFDLATRDLTTPGKFAKNLAAAAPAAGSEKKGVSKTKSRATQKAAASKKAAKEDRKLKSADRKELKKLAAAEKGEDADADMADAEAAPKKASSKNKTAAAAPASAEKPKATKRKAAEVDSEAATEEAAPKKKAAAKKSADAPTEVAAPAEKKRKVKA